MKINSSKYGRGFTLIEMMGVLVIILIVGAAVGLAIKPPDGTVAVNSSVRVLSSLVKSARANALLKQAPARLIIHADPSEESKFLRYFGIVYYDEENGGWVATGSPLFLPENVYFVPPSGTQGVEFNGMESGVRSSFNYQGAGGNTMQLQDYPQTQVMAATGTSYYFYEFSETGISQNKNADLLVAPGTLQYQASGSVVVFSDNPYSVSGFRIRKSGSVAIFTDYDDIKN